eukprot:CAMPEP_0179099058 /NCGR_PEP_ID=MMETSP0796-20121207/45680_1 /TAXON_ID=73915 /ORGANISM="Pyrodinium bahamense, Strain pbaha01" /LENGTH=217 /DNA_ID=CAMNT_0020796849 /DNA_START=63 /DNA_END=716 /DNA_ORIENTATION=-
MGALCRLKWCVVLAAASVAGVSSEKDNIAKLTKFNFESNVRHGIWFVKFYAPWCAHCQKLAPIWEKLADQAIARDWPVRIAEVDCTSSKAVCEKANVQAYPTLGLIDNGVMKEKYKGKASVSHFEEWLNAQHVLKAGSAKGSSLDATSDSRSKPTASHVTAAGAVISNFVARFPTKSKIINLYVFGAVGLAMLVAFLCTLFRLVDAEDPGDEHEKEG